MIKNFSVSPAPHLRTPDSAPRRTWRFVLALMPALLVMIVHRPLEMARMLGLVFLSSFLIEALFVWAAQRKVNFNDGTSILWATLLSLMLPEDAGAAMIVFSSAVAVFLGKEFFGGRAGVWAHPAWLGCAFFALTFPGIFLSQFSFWNPFSGFWPALTTLALLSGGVFLMMKRNSPWEVSLLYIGLILTASQLIEMRTSLSLPGVLLSAFWVLPETAVSPCTHRGKICASLAAALLTIALGFLNAPAAPVFGVLVVNLMMPWIDEWILPRGISFEAQVREARSFQ